MSTQAETQPVIAFEHVNLNTVDPSTSAIAEGTYNLEVAKAGIVDFVYKKGKNIGQEGQRLEFTFVVTDSPTSSGRRVFQSLFAGNGTNKQLRKIMDATGIPQEPDQPLSEWLTELATQRAKFSCPVGMVDDKDANGNPRKSVRANLWEASPSL